MGIKCTIKVYDVALFTILQYLLIQQSLLFATPPRIKQGKGRPPVVWPATGM